VDLIPHEGVDIVGDVFEVLAGVPDGAIDEVFSSHFLEHVEDVELLLRQIVRVLRPGGRLELVVPHFSNPYFYSDLTHRHHFGLYSLAYLMETTMFSRAVPSYGDRLPLALEDVRLVFKSPRPFYGRYAIKRAIGALVNLSRWTQEVYEENFAWMAPCYEIRYELVRR
jgi:ubiquinone/menaquinone biosynthesis C-methylase UbiE